MILLRSRKVLKKKRKKKMERKRLDIIYIIARKVQR